jgi:hypothetical protein
MFIMNAPESTPDNPTTTIYCVGMSLTRDLLGRKAIGIEVVPPLKPADAERLANILSGKVPGIKGVINHMIVASTGPESTSFVANNHDGEFQPPDAISLGVALQNLISPSHVSDIRVVNGAAQSVPGVRR